MKPHHEPVLLKEVLDAMRWERPGVHICDLTVGGGGHLGALLEANPKPGRVVAVDQDPFALQQAQEKLKAFPEIEYVHSNFSHFLKGTAHPFDRILCDLGVSSFQLDDAERGFSFRKDGPLDMRMDTTRGLTAAEWLSVAREEELKKVFWELGEERRGAIFARKLVSERKTTPPTTTRELVEALGYRLDSRDPRGHHPLTKVFQAIRLFINDELGVLQAALESLPGKLNLGGRVSIITFHSLEDRLVKWALRGQLKSGLKAINKKVIVPSNEETKANARSRSAKLRVYEKVPLEEVDSKFHEGDSSFSD